MTTVLRLETMAYNRLLNIIKTDLCRLEAALQGHIVMSVEVEAAYEDVQKEQLPSTWRTFSYPTENMLNDYLEVKCLLSFEYSRLSYINWLIQSIYIIGFLSTSLNLLKM